MSRLDRRPTSEVKTYGLSRFREGEALGPAPSPALRAPSPRGGEGEKTPGRSWKLGASDRSSPSPRRGEGWGEGAANRRLLVPPPHPPFGHPLPVGARGKKGRVVPESWAPAIGRRPRPDGERDGVRGPRIVALLVPPPHPPFGHPLPVGARGKKGRAIPGSWRQRSSSPSPRRGEGWGEGAADPLYRPVGRDRDTQRPTPPSDKLFITSGSPSPYRAKALRTCRLSSDPVYTTRGRGVWISRSHKRNRRRYAD